MKFDSNESAALNLGVVRFLYFTMVFFFLAPAGYFQAWGLAPEEFWKPVGVLAFFDTPPVSSEAFRTINTFWVVSIPVCALGLFYRIVAPFNFLAGFFVTNYASSFGVNTHTYLPVILAGLPLAFSFASDSFSLDRHFFRKTQPCDSRIYVAPVRTMQVVFCLVFFISAIAKLRFGGVEWVTSNTLQNYLFRAAQIFPDAHRLATELKFGLWLYQHEALLHWIAGSTIVFELLVPVAYFYRPSVKFIVPLMMTMQVGFFFAMYVNFISFLAIYVVWINWSSIDKQLRLWIKPRLP